MIGFPLKMPTPVLEVKVEKPIAVMACAASNSHDTGSAWADAPGEKSAASSLAWSPSRVRSCWIGSKQGW
jgi:hypothetical protein